VVGKFVRAIANYVDVVVITQVRNKPNIDRAGMGRSRLYRYREDRCPIYKLTAALRGGTNTGWTIQMAMAYPSYLAFEWAAWKRFHRDLRNGRFDVVHRITPMSPTSPISQMEPSSILA